MPDAIESVAFSDFKDFSNSFQEEIIVVAKDLPSATTILFCVGRVW
jgi:hypothetical protein